MKSTVKAAMIAATSMAIAGIGVGAAQWAQAEPTPAPSASASATPGQHANGASRHKGKMGHGGQRLEQSMAQELASKLGVDEAKVKQALIEVRDEHKADKTRSKGDRQAEMAKSLASKLGVDEAKVKTALDEIRSTRQDANSAQRETALKSRLDQAVKDGKLTQAEADAVIKAHKAGVLGR